MNKKLLLLLVPLLLSTGKSYAETADSHEFDMPEVVVTATKTVMNIQDVPAAVEVITAEDIQSYGAHILKDVIGSAAGVSIMRANGREALSIRGFDARYSMILIDGKRIPAEPDPYYELDRISLENVERIEIVRGPVTSLYGADALGGVVNIITKTASKETFTLRLNQGVLSRTGDRNGRYSFTYDSGKQEKFGMTLSGSYSDSDASLKSNGTTYSPFGERKNMNARFEYSPTDKETLTFTASRMEEDTREYAILQTAMGNVRTDVRDNNDRSQYALSYTKDLSDGELYFNAYRSVWDKYNDTVNRTSGQYINSVYGYTTISGLEARISKKVSDDHLLTLGGEYRPELFRGTGIQTGQGTFTKVFHGKVYEGSEVKTNYSAVYLQDQWTVSPKLLAVASARYDDSNKFESNVSPKIGVTYTPEPGWRVKFNAGQGFRVPSPNQLYLKLNVTRNGNLVSLLGNPSLKPEDSTSYDLSVERDVGNVKSKLTFFTSKITDMIDEAWVDSATVKYQNINRATIQGIEGEISVPLSDRLSWSGNYTYLDATNDLTNTRLYNRARHKLSSRVSYRQSETLTANLWVDSYLHYWFQPAANISTNTSYTLWNMNVEKQLTKNQTLLLGIDNIFNHKDDALSLPGAFIHVDLTMKL
ncbi:outer membrane receptor for ferrienterochelin and colicins [Pelosinus fermentans]|uniref:TonB-dependent receptor plug domain-containing protein n=1 Tax=Pelosinus fermentans TaxID=365349 RepID=UPI00026863EE|nr:TonB-dependent receptor [Pelosinus fermentans]OAM92472.1 TonB-dependent receptor [Pelosinus fermentans DSM 17108]SDQ46012.1 outer membrane receptor for ferrienterochelin and colicins [Pelosinus fermentans]